MNVAGLVLVLALGNIMANPVMPQADVRHDIETLFRQRAAVTCGSEIDPPRYRRAWRRLAARHGLTAAGTAAPDPAAVRGRPRAVSVHRISRGVAGLTPDRFAVVVRLPHVAVVCTHLVSRAWTTHDATTPLRRRIYAAEIAAIRAIVERHLAAGRSVIVAGDLNNPGRVVWDRRQVFLGNVYRMQAAAIPAPGWTARRLYRGRTISPARLFTDHPILRRLVALSPVAHVG